MTKLSRLLDSEMADGAYQDPTTSRVRRPNRENVGLGRWWTRNFESASASAAKSKSR